MVGRSSQVEFSLPEDGFLSRQHFQIEFSPPSCVLRDLGSTNGTKVNGVRVASIRLRDGDWVEAGQCRFQVQIEESLGKIKCVGCDTAAPSGTVPIPALGDTAVQWVCDACAIQRRHFPLPPPGYWIEERIGGGGMGEVYRARRLADNRPVAIKMMNPAIATSAKARGYFHRELEILRDLRHPHIVAFFDMVEMDEQFQLIMEYVEGRHARKWVESLPTRLSIPAAIRIGVQLLSALEHAHGKGYVHRDIKPSNLLVYGPPVRPTVKLSDFGLAKSVLDNAGFATLTHQGDVGGSVGFLSPDHLRDFREVKAPADIYSASATLYFLLTGKYPYLDFDPTSPDAYHMILEHPAVPLRAHRPDAPEALDRVLRKALEKHPRDRWKSATEMGIALQSLADTKSTPPADASLQLEP
jgi:serine/threonine-protein kinase